MYGGEALSRALFVLLPHHRSVARPPLSLERPVGFAPPPCSGFAFLAAPRRQHIASAPYSCERESYVRQSTKRAPNFLELCARELRRIPLLGNRVNKALARVAHTKKKPEPPCRGLRLRCATSSSLEEVVPPCAR